MTRTVRFAQPGDRRRPVVRRRLRARTSRHQVPVFVVLALVVSWSVWPLMLLNPTSSPMVPFGPAVAAVVVVATVGGRGAVAHLLRQLVHWRVGPLWYLAALSPFAIGALVAVLATGAGAPVPTAEVLSGWASAMPTVFLSTLIVIGLFEELGWRGYALPRLQRDHSALWSALVLGAVWLLWHLPELVADPAQRPLLPFAVTVLAQSIIMTWLYNSTRGALPLVMVFHAAVDTSAQILLPQLAGAAYLSAWWSLAAVYALVAGALVRRTGSGSALLPSPGPGAPSPDDIRRTVGR